MRKLIVTVVLAFLFGNCINAQNVGSVPDTDHTLPVRALEIVVPQPAGVDAFVEFIRAELGPRGVNTLLLRVDYYYQYKSHPELIAENALSEADVKKIVKACKDWNIRVIPEINLLGHQSYLSHVFKLLEMYPQFDETPRLKVPEPGARPGEGGVFMKSYCPLHPDLHAVVFDVMDELIEVFETDAFHCGMDEVFYIADEQCPRCSGHDPAELFAGEATRLRNHLAEKGVQMWIWGDRLLDGRNSSMGKWEASMNNTYRAIDMIPKDIVICDWHYERPEQSAVYFAMKGFHVVTCTWKNAKVALDQKADMFRFRKNSNPQMSDRFLGMMSTVWVEVNKEFLDEFYTKDENKASTGFSESDAFMSLFPKK